MKYVFRDFTNTQTHKHEAHKLKLKICTYRIERAELFWIVSDSLRESTYETRKFYYNIKNDAVVTYSGSLGS